MLQPKLEVWIQTKLIKIRDVVAQCVRHESWEAQSEHVNHSQSVVQVFFILNETVETLHEFVG